MAIAAFHPDTAAASGPVADSQRPELQRGIGRFGFFALAFGSMIGVGWVTAMGTWLNAAGPLGAVLGFALGGLRTLATMILASIVGATVFYCALIWSVARAGPWQEIAGADMPTAEAFRTSMGSPLLANLVLVAALLGLLTSWNGFFLAGSRVLFALGRGHIAPAALGSAHPRFGTPAVAVLVTGAVTAVGACLGRGAMVAFIDVGSFCIALAFLGVTFSA